MMENTYRFLGDSILGIYGAGHLGMALACSLLESGLPRMKLAICHRGSKDTYRKLTEAGLSELIADPDHVVRHSKILLYIVRPQDYRSIAGCTMPADAQLISFLAGIPLAHIPAPLPESQRVRISISAPDTLRRRCGIAAIYPAEKIVAREILTSLELLVFPLRQEADMHAFVAFGSCLPIALMYWEHLGRQVEETELLETAAQFGLPDYPRVLSWARTVQPRPLTREEQDHYITQAATPGGITEAILRAMENGFPLSAALMQGVERGRELGGS